MISPDGLGWLAELASATVTPVESASAKVAAQAWYDVAWNPTGGCSPAGPGCDHCDAMRTVAQLARMGGKAGARYAGLTATRRSGSAWTGELRVRDDVLTWPLVQRKGRRILVASLSDLFHERLAIEAVDAVHAVMTVAHWHRFLILTRRAERMRAYYADPQTPRRIAAEIARLAARAMPGLGSAPRSRDSDAGAGLVIGAGARRDRVAELARVVCRTADADRDEPGASELDSWPLHNLWLGVSVEDRDRVGRIGELLQTPAVRRWACFEPLLGPVRPDLVPVGDDGYVDGLCGDRFDLDRRGRRLPLDGPALPALDWVVAGGETGSAARPTVPNWMRDLRDHCTVAGVPFFFKQWGEWGPAPEDISGQKVVRLGRRRSGRTIDGRTWDEMPPVLRGRMRKPR